MGAAAQTVDLLVLRWPKLSVAEVVSRIRRLLQIEPRPPLAAHGRFDLALSLGLEGVHLGEGDLPPALVRSQAPDLVIGCSRHDPAGVGRSRAADYCTVSPFAPTLSKPGAAPLTRAEFVRCCASEGPAVLALGGVDSSNATEALDCGAAGIATIRGVFGRSDPEAALYELREMVGDEDLSSRSPEAEA